MVRRVQQVRKGARQFHLFVIVERKPHGRIARQSVVLDVVDSKSPLVCMTERRERCEAGRGRSVRWATMGTNRHGVGSDARLNRANQIPVIAQTFLLL